MFSLTDLLEKIKPFYTLILIMVIASIFFALWKISVIESNGTPIKIEYGTISPRSHLGQSEIEQSDEVVASKNGTKYYFSWCGSASRIKPENLVKFSSIEEARKADYTPAGNCKGLK